MLYKFQDCVEDDVTIDGDHNVQFVAAFTLFEKPVRIKNCSIEKLDLLATYFLGGLEITNCRILCDVNWQSGGHNRQPIQIVDSEFLGFLDTEDCIFEAEVSLQTVKIPKGSNLLGNIGTPVEVIFETAPTLDMIEGRINVDTFQPTSAQPHHPDGSKPH